MKTEFSTFDISKLLGIGKSSMQAWIGSGYIRPSIQPASGQGRRALFSREDLYRIHTFQVLSDMGFHRNLAKGCSDISFINVGSGADDFKYAEVKMSLIPNPYTSMTMQNISLHKTAPVTQLSRSEYLVCMINLLAIKDTVDDLIKKG